MLWQAQQVGGRACTANHVHDIKRQYKLWKHVSGTMHMSFALSIVEFPLALSCPADERLKLPGSWYYIIPYTYS